MPAVEFKLNDKDYLEKLNLMSAQAGDVQQAKADTEKALSDAVKVLSDTENVRDVDIVNLLNEVIAQRDATNAIAVGEINALDVDFNSVKVKGEDVALVNETQANIDKKTDKTASATIKIFALSGMVM